MRFLFGLYNVKYRAAWVFSRCYYIPLCDTNAAIMFCNRLFFIFPLMMFTSACDKTQSTPTRVAPEGQIVKACDGRTLCYLLNEEKYSFYGNWRKVSGSSTTPNATRLYYEAEKGKFRIQIDMYGVTPGTYGIMKDGPFRAGDASFTYFDGTVNLKAVSGVVVLSDVNNANNTISGSFDVTAETGDTVYKITEGLFVDVTQK